ncbi:MAG TPA: hypothetical protein VEP89_02595 [Draconibacterium sp.]|nr:hypothetical protein [Draconibacterium sp.]
MKTSILLIIALTTIAISSRSQDIMPPQDTLRKNAVKVFIDSRGLDMNHLRREIPYVNYVRDVKDAQLYIRETNQSTGSGGQEYTYFFVGQDKFRGLTDTLVYASSPDDTFEQVRQGRTDMLKMGLMRYVARTPIYKEVKIEYTAVSQEEEEVVDRWNNWVFEIETEPDYEWEDTRNEISIRNTISATKVTEDWKMEARLNHRYTKSNFEFVDETFTAIERQLSSNVLVVKSLSQHWSTGVKSDFLQSSRQNYDYQISAYPSIEYNLFPYSESTHRQLRILYGIGPEINNYTDTTIFGETQETLTRHELNIAYEVRERWGSVNFSLQGTNYLNDFSKYRLSMDGFLNIRILRGLSFNLRGGVAKVSDQINLSAGGVSDEEVLLNLRERATTYRINTGFGFTYTFGSIYNNVVNPRFGNGRGGGGFGGGGRR